MYFCMRRKSLVHTPDDRPKAVELESRIMASSSPATRRIGTNRTERLLHHQFAVMRHPVDDDGRQERAPDDRGL